PDALQGSVFVGELALDGAVRPVRGVLPIAAWARAQRVRRLFVPRANGHEAAVVAGDCAVQPVAALSEVVAALRGEGEVPRAAPAGVPAAGASLPSAEGAPDLAEVRGQEVA